MGGNTQINFSMMRDMHIVSSMTEQYSVDSFILNGTKCVLQPAPKAQLGPPRVGSVYKSEDGRVTITFLDVRRYKMGSETCGYSMTEDSAGDAQILFSIGAMHGSIVTEQYS